MNLAKLPTDDFSYPAWEWPDTATHLLFDLGFSYGMLRHAETMLEALYLALKEHESEGTPENTILRERLEEMLGRMRNFRERRLNARDDIYNAGYLAAAKLDANEAAEPGAV